MEALDGHNRQSGIHSLINREQDDRQQTDPPAMAMTMAATAVISPTSSIYTNGPPPPYSSGWSGPAAHPVLGLISPPDSRRTSDNKTEPPPPIQTSQPHRQSLPSIHEALSSGPKQSSYASPVSASLPPHQIPFSQPQSAPIPRPYPPSDHAPYQSQHTPSQSRQHSPPQPVHPQPNFSRPEPATVSFAEAPRHPSISSLQAAPGPHNPYAVPRYEPTRYEHDPRIPERIPNGYPPHPPPLQQQPSYNYGPNSSQVPPPGPHAPVFSQPRYGPQDPRDQWKGEKQEPVLFRAGVKRHLDVWDFENNLAEINISSSSLHEWSAHYNAIAQEQQRPITALPERMPSLESVEDMLRHNLKITNALNNMQNIIRDQQESIREQRMREQGARGPGEYEDEMGSIYGDDGRNYASEGKKRRGRAAHPGRCHSCNRAETPEWRRGPDGARTLCNACGLHYAKLTRKNTMKQSQGSNGSSLRPKSMDDSSPRPM